MLLVRKSFARAARESHIADTRPFPSSRELPLLFSQEAKRIGLTFDVLPVQYHAYYAGILAGKEFVDISLINRELRAVKSPWEQERLRENGRRLAEVFAQIPSFFVRACGRLTWLRSLNIASRKRTAKGMCGRVHSAWTWSVLPRRGCRRQFREALTGPRPGRAYLLHALSDRPRHPLPAMRRY